MPKSYRGFNTDARITRGVEASVETPNLATQKLIANG